MPMRQVPIGSPVYALFCFGMTYAMTYANRRTSPVSSDSRHIGKVGSVSSDGPNLF